MLRDFAKADRVWVEKTLEAVSDAVPLLLAGNEAEFMSRVALLTQPPKQKKPAATEKS